MKCFKCNKEIKGLSYRFLAESTPERAKKTPWVKKERTRLKARVFLDYFKPDEQERVYCKECGVKEIFK